MEERFKKAACSSEDNKSIQLSITISLSVMNICSFFYSGGSSPGFNDKTHSVDVQKLYKLQEELTELHKKRGEVLKYWNIVLRIFRHIFLLFFIYLSIKNKQML